MTEAVAAVSESKICLHKANGIEQERRSAESLFQNLKLRAYGTRRKIYNALWPTTWKNLFGAMQMILLVMHIDHPKLNWSSQYLWIVGDYLYLDESYPYLFRMLVIALISSFIYFIVTLFARQYLLRILLAYKGWLYKPPRSQSLIVLFWALCVRFISGRHPRLYAYQNSLPRMNVPPLKSTVSKFLKSVKPLLGKDEYKKMEEDATEFMSTIGPKSQWILKLKSWWKPNFCTDWWEKYVYLMGRDPIAINSNYYAMDQRKWCPTKVQAARAAGISFLILVFKKLVDTEKLDPLVIQKTVPLCMHQYRRIFSTSRIPKTDQDELRHHSGSEHIVVLCKGHYYKLYIVDAHGKRLNVLDLQSQFEWILKDSEGYAVSNATVLKIAALTGSNRNNWAKIRSQHFSCGINQRSLHAIDESIFLMVLDDTEHKDMSARGKHLLHGDGSSIWFDKTFNVIVFKDGKVGLNCEHSWGDAPIMSHLLEYVVTSEYLYRIYDEEGNCKPFISPDAVNIHRSKSLIAPMRLYWNVNNELARSINEAYVMCLKNNADLALTIRNHDAFGKEFIKTTKISPDAYIQMALQLAYYRDSKGKFALTYESSMTRLYLHGRTETVRSFTEDVKQFVLAMNDENVSAKEKFRLMHLAGNKHQELYRDCMSGKGIDRHLFSLYVVCRGSGHESTFLKSALTLPWTLSTSQQPQLQMNVLASAPEIVDSMSPGGGFGPVADNGYGVSYMIAGDKIIYFHVSSKVSAENTDGERFVENVFWALSEMRRVAMEAKKVKDQ